MNKTLTRCPLTTVILLCALILMGVTAFSGCGSDSSQSPGSSPVLVFGLIGQSTDKVLAALSEKGVSITNTTTPGSDLDGIIIDCSNSSLSELLQNSAVRQFLDKGIILIDLATADKSELTSQVGFAGNVENTSELYFMKAVPGFEGQEFEIYDYPQAITLHRDQFTSFEKDDDPATNEEDPANNASDIFDETLFNEGQQEFLDSISSDILDYFCTSVIDSYSADSSRAERSKPPAQAKYLTWTYTKFTLFNLAASWCMIYNPNFGFDRFKVLFPSTSHKGSQTIRFGNTVKISLLLDNDPKSQTGPFQHLTVDYAGQTNPQYQHSGWLPMNGLEGKSDNGGGSWSPTSVTAWQWAQTAFSSTIGLGGAGEHDLFLVEETPPNVSNVTSYTSGYSFTVGFNAGLSIYGPAAGVSSAFTRSNSKITNIQDWGCIFTEQPGVINYKEFKWFWHTENPAYTNEPYPGKFEGFNTLAYNLFEPTASLVLKTNSTSSNQLELGLTDYIQQMACVFRHNTLLHHYSQTYFNTPHGLHSDETVVYIDLGAIFYPDISGLNIAPASVTAGQEATGTVSLDNPAKHEVVINLRSEQTDWATVPEKITIPPGQQQADFQIQTKNVTGSPTVNIEATHRRIKAKSNLVVEGS